MLVVAHGMGKARPKWLTATNDGLGNSKYDILRWQQTTQPAYVFPIVSDYGMDASLNLSFSALWLSRIMQHTNVQLILELYGMQWWPQNI